MRLKKLLETSFIVQPRDANQKLEIYKCKYCGQQYARHITRMSIHLLKCPTCPATAKELLREKMKDRILESSTYGFNKKGLVKNLKKILEENFISQPRDGSQKLEIFKCKHCEQRYARNASRMSSHLQKCFECPQEVKTAIKLNIQGNKNHKGGRQLIPKKLLESSFVVQPKEPNQKLQTFKCKYCGQVYARHSTRMSLHLQKCIGCPGNVKESLAQKPIKVDQKVHEMNFKQSQSESEGVMSDDEGNVGVVQVSSEGMYSNHPLNESFIDRMSKQRQKYCEELMAKAIYATNAPVNIVDNEHWRSLFNTLSPAFELPTQHQLSTSLLDVTYLNVKKCVEQRVRDALSLGLQCSYRSTVKNEGIIQLVLNTPDPVLFKSVTLSTNIEDENLYLERITEVIDEVGSERVLGVCLDCVSTCENLWEILQQKYEEHNISFYYCSSQTLNRLLKEITEIPSVSALLKQVSSVMKEAKQSHILSSLLDEYQRIAAEKSQTSNSTKSIETKKWNSSLICLESLLENKANSQVLVFSAKADKFIHKSTKELIVDDEFWTKLNSYVKLIKPIIKWISHLDDEEAKISEVPEVFIDLEQHFITEFQEPSLVLLSAEESDLILKRFKTLSSAVLKPIHFAANILNPLLKGEHLSGVDFISGTEVISKLSQKFGMPEDDILVDLANYNSGKGIWSANFVKKSISLMPPSTWWRGFFKNSFLTKIATAILDLPSISLATTDRSNKRFSVKDDPTGKIMYTHQNLRLLDPKRTERNRIPEEQFRERFQEEFTEDDFGAYSEDIEEVLVEDPEESIEESEEIIGELVEENENDPNSGLYIQIVNDAGETFLVQQNVTL